MNGVVVRNIDRADRAAVAELARFGVATIHEAQGRTGLMRPFMRPIHPGARACGTALTVLAHPGDNWMLHVAAEMIAPGDVVVVALSADNTDGMFASCSPRRTARSGRRAWSSRPAVGTSERSTRWASRCGRVPFPRKGPSRPQSAR
jgi:4-hydroxy-4-methyl-2-oxoglutarate aldolase